MGDKHVKLTCACGRRHVLDVAPDPGDPRGQLVALAQGWGVIKGPTLMRWAHSGRLHAYTAERGRLIAWESDVRAAVEAEPYTSTDSEPSTTAICAELGDLADDPALEAAE